MSLEFYQTSPESKPPLDLTEREEALGILKRKRAIGEKYSDVTPPLVRAPFVMPTRETNDNPAAEPSEPHYDLSQEE